jgi:hypothetical protein
MSSPSVSKITRWFHPKHRIAYRVMLTVPVSEASGQLTFSKLKIIKDYLRTTMA